MKTLNEYSTTIAQRIIARLPKNQISISLGKPSQPPVKITRMQVINTSEGIGTIYEISESYGTGKKRILGPQIELLAIPDRSGPTRKAKIFPLSFSNKAISIKTRSYSRKGRDLIIQDPKLQESLIHPCGAMLTAVFYKGYLNQR